MDKNSFKLVLIGDSGVGKSTIVQWLVLNKRTLDNCPTIGASYLTKEITLLENNGNNLPVKIKYNIWDTAGQERFRSMVKLYYKNTHGCLCVFDLTNRESFINLSKWIADYKEYNENKNYVMMLVANKSDHAESKWQVTMNEIKDFAEKLNCNYMFTNGLDGSGIIEVFRELGKSIFKLNGITIQKNYVTDENRPKELFNTIGIQDKPHENKYFLHCKC